MATNFPYTPTVSPLGPETEHGQTFVVKDYSGAEVERLHYKPDGTLSYRQVSFWSVLPDGGKMIRRWSMDPDGTLRESLEGRKDAQDRIKSQIYYSADGNIIDRQEYHYDDATSEMTFTRWNSDADIVEEWKTSRE